MAIGKRQIVLAALVLALGAAVYLNWQFSGSNLSATDATASGTTASGKELGEAQFVNNPQTGSSVASAVTSSGTASTSSVANTPLNQQFTEAQLNRQKARDAAVELLKEVLTDGSKSDAAKTEAVKQAAMIAQTTQQENNIESLIKAKGFKNCVAYIQNSQCSVIVQAPNGLLPSDAIAIKDIVSGQSGISFDNIKIQEAK